MREVPMAEIPVLVQIAFGVAEETDDRVHTTVTDTRNRVFYVHGETEDEITRNALIRANEEYPAQSADPSGIPLAFKATLLRRTA